MLFPTYEIGSLPKRKDFKGEKASIANIIFLEDIGLDYVYDGEAQRIEMYEYPARKIKGLEIQDWIRSFDNKYYRKASAKQLPFAAHEYHVDEFKIVKQSAIEKIKVPITGPYTMMDWTYQEIYSREEIAFEFANIVKQQIKALVEEGATWIQIDEPGASTKPDEIKLMIDCINHAIDKKIHRDCILSIHVCYSDYKQLYPEILELKVDHLSFEYKNKNNYEEMFKLYNEQGETREIGLGVIDVHTNRIETPEEIQKIILNASKKLENTLYVCPDCGLRTRTWEVVEKKLHNMVKGAEMARREVE